MTKISNLGITSKDSLKLRIPISSLDSFDIALNDVFITTNQTTGEIEKEFKRQSKQYFCDCYSFYVSLSNVRTSKERFEDCIILLLNSKQLEGRYFEGLTLDSIKVIYNKVIELGILKCDFSTFLGGSATDVDFKKDYQMEMDNYKEIIKGCSLMSKDSNQVDVGKRLHKGESNLGISWSKRETSKYIANPFTKIYHKGLEFISPKDKGGSKEFKDKYLSHIDTSNIIRIETTVKNKRHLESLKLDLKYFTLFDLLSMSVEQNDWVIKSAVNKHLGNRVKVMAFKKETELSPKLDFELKALLVCTTESNWSLIRAIEYFSNGIENKDTRSRLKKRLTKLYDDYIKETDYAPKVDKVNSFFDSIGWF
jgi:hypothetical protein|tara:strand:+ start:681 stop:1778 length:1098 start_codon:yes stop_codon:yes gene_type:complete